MEAKDLELNYMKKTFLLLVALIFCFAACSKDDDVKVESIALDSSQEYMLVGDTVVLTAAFLPDAAAVSAGVEWSSSDDDIVSVDDGVVIAKHSGAANITASAANGSKTAVCAITIGDLYIYGYDPDFSYNYPACWINWREYLDPDLRSNFVITIGGDIYSLGSPAFFTNEGRVIKNGAELYLLNDGGNYFDLENIVVQGNDVYVVGVNRGAKKYGKTKGITLWKNGVASNIYTEAGVSDPVLFVSGDDVYVAFETYDNTGSNPILKVWHNGTVSIFDNAPYANAIVRDIYVSEGDIYVLGELYNSYSDNHILSFWKNGIRTDIVDGSHKAFSVHIIVSGDDAFVTGYEMNDDETSIAKIWKNGKELVLSDGLYGAIARGICLYGGKLYVVTGLTGTEHLHCHSSMYVIDPVSFKVLKTKSYDGADFTELAIYNY